ncbi:hypothetical protein WJX73_002365 [Symbiochloris irregularis]|uniref:F-box domain-containing protein n=1 Tax=Symbiochloris irregularis TaxID=706552 RepID=A0AAW1PWV3_9CHLO
MLPADILYKVFSALDFCSKVKCQRVCKSWNDLLRQPGSPLWGIIHIKTNAFHLDQRPSVSTASNCASLWAPLCRWLAVRASRSGIKAISFDCYCCCSHDETCAEVSASLMAFLGCMKSVPVDVHLKITCCSKELIFMTNLSVGLIRDLAARLSRLQSLELGGQGEQHRWSQESLFHSHAAAMAMHASGSQCRIVY